MKFTLKINSYIKIGALFILPLIITSSSCRQPKQDDVHHQQIHSTFYNNIIIASDLSNRITSKYPKPISDELIINALIDNFKSKISKSNNVSNEKGAIKFCFINNGLLKDTALQPFISIFNKIDLSTFGFKMDERNKYIRTQLPVDLNRLKEGIATSYNLALKNQSGSDIWSFLNNLDAQTIQDSIIGKASTINNEVKQINKRKNVLVLFTDGYLESSDNSPEYSLSGDKLEAIRNDYLKSNQSGISIDSFLSQHHEYNIKPLSNPLLANLDIIVLELYDRTLTPAGTVTKRPTDYEIIKSIWGRWLQQSKVKSYRLYPITTSVQSSINSINEFIK